MNKTANKANSVDAKSCVADYRRSLLEIKQHWAMIRAHDLG